MVTAAATEPNRKRADQGVDHLVTPLLNAMEEQKQPQANQIETLTTQRIDALQTKMIQTQLSSIQAAPSAKLSSADVARKPLGSQPSNAWTLSSLNTTPPTTDDALYCTVDASRVGEGDKAKAHPRSIRQAIEKEICTMEGHEDWRCTAVVKGARTESIRVTCRDEIELQRVKEAA